jgi:hypothetical protein
MTSSLRPKEGPRTELNIIYGEWFPGKIVGFTRVSAMDDETYKKFIEQYSLFFYSRAYVQVGDRKLNDPVYKIKSSDSEAFADDWQIELSTLGINTEEVTIISIGQDETTDWINPGTTLILNNENRIISIWDGGFFELLKN